jgi:hypothetical protein
MQIEHINKSFPSLLDHCKMKIHVFRYIFVKSKCCIGNWQITATLRISESIKYVYQSPMLPPFPSPFFPLNAFCVHVFSFCKVVLQKCKKCFTKNFYKFIIVLNSGATLRFSCYNGATLKGNIMSDNKNKEKRVKTKVIRARVNDDLFEALTNYANRVGKTKTEIIDTFLNELLKDDLKKLEDLK